MTPGTGQFEFGPFRLDFDKRVLWRKEEIVPLPPKALDLLVALVEGQGDVVRKEALMERVWPHTFVEEANLSVNISALRKALGERPSGQSYIQTIPRRGYRFVGTGKQPPRATTLAVLPFKALGQEREDGYLGAGMADALITRLSATGQIMVRPMGTVIRYADHDPLESGRALHVDAVLDGKIQRLGSRLRLTVQLVPVVEGAPAWAGTFDEEFTNIFAVQDQAAEKVARASKALEIDDSVADAHISLAYVSLFQDWCWAKAEAELERAVALNDKSAAPRQWRGLYLDMRGRFDEARAEIERAQQLDPVSMITTTLMAFQFNLAREYDRELEECLKAVEMAPTIFSGTGPLGWLSSTRAVPGRPSSSTARPFGCPTTRPS